ncbi:adenylate/guanylate cyclase domain-containing protein [Aureimonas sp. Leaf454]|uniref:CHASE2 domain-containing protein n=1 Tax=Aureimonas sp. Leaf454 TaxID=1736381 RepID=UPI000A53B70A|nr:adenylate/guanylate cyclase domain-containing protein [Aureimonas sp. Leaf454]
MRAGGWRHGLGGAAILAAALLWTGWLGQQHVAGLRSLVDRFEEPLTDLRLRLAGPATPPAEVVIVAIDDETVAAEGGYPLDRSRLAFLLSAIRTAGAKTIGLDILLADPGNAISDAALARALAGGHSVITAAGRFAPGDARLASMPRLDGELRPLAAFEAASSVGLANVSTNDAGTPRHLPLVFASPTGPLPGFALRAAALHRGVDPRLSTDHVAIADHVVPLDIGWHLPLRLFGPAGSVRTIGAEAFLRDGAVPPSLEGAIAIVGVTATAVGDTFGTPFDAVTPGVEIQASGIATLLGGPGLVRTTTLRWIDVAVALLLAGAGTLIVLGVPLTRGLPLVALVLAAFAAANAAIFAAGIWMSAALPLVSALPPLAAAVLRRQTLERRRARAAEEAEASLRRFQPLAIAERIAHDPAFLRQPVEQLAAVLFVDLSGFSGRSETIGPARTQDLLKAFHTLIVDVVEAHDGLVLNFMGDGAMIVFGAIEPAPDPAGRAIRAAQALFSRASRWLGRETPDGRGLGLRLGLHLGPVVLSRLGHEHHQQISISGNTVNLASRLMEVAKIEGATMVASAALLDALDASGPSIDPPDDRRAVGIRGLREHVVVGLWYPARDREDREADRSGSHRDER